MRKLPVMELKWVDLLVGSNHCSITLAIIPGATAPPSCALSIHVLSLNVRLTSRLLPAPLSRALAWPTYGRDHISEFVRANTAVQITDHPIIYSKSSSAPATTSKVSSASP